MKEILKDSEDNTSTSILKGFILGFDRGKFGSPHRLISRFLIDKSGIEALIKFILGED